MKCDGKVVMEVVDGKLLTKDGEVLCECSSVEEQELLVKLMLLED